MRAWACTGCRIHPSQPNRNSICQNTDPSMHLFELIRHRYLPTVSPMLARWAGGAAFAPAGVFWARRQPGLLIRRVQGLVVRAFRFRPRTGGIDCSVSSIRPSLTRGIGPSEREDFKSESMESRGCYSRITIRTGNGERFQETLGA